MLNALQQSEDDRANVELGWAALPTSYRIPEVAPTLAAARRYCQELADSHYENFHVVSWFLPKALRPHFHALYAYCRISDDLGDEVGDPAQSLALLRLWGEELDACYAGQARHPVFVALRETILACGIPKEPFADLLKAFSQDQTTVRYATRRDVLEYCRYSANPVGRLVLHACGEVDAERFRLSDATCTGLQLANFWQDVGRDYLKGRIYLPQDQMAQHGVDESVIANRTFTNGFARLLQQEVEFTRGLFTQGLALVDLVSRDLAVDLELFSRGGLEILNAIERQGFDVLTSRPEISRSTKLRLAARAAAGKALPFLRPRRPPARATP